MKAEPRADSYIYGPDNRMPQILGDAVHDPILADNPCSRRTSPGGGRQRAYVWRPRRMVWAI
jgi:hypothetical protein